MSTSPASAPAPTGAPCHDPIRPASDAGFLEAASRIIFMGGLNRQVVDNKWAAFREVFHAFDPARVAAMTPSDIERLMGDARIIRNQKRLEAVVTNADTVAALARDHGSFGAWLDGLYASTGVDGAAKELAARFAYISDAGARNWLYATGYDVGTVTDKQRKKYAPA